MTRFLIGAVIAALGLTAQASEPDGAHDGAVWQIWAYSSAAPAPLGTNATVLGLDGSVPVSYTHLTLPTTTIV